MGYWESPSGVGTIPAWNRRAVPPRLPEEEAFLLAAEAKVRLTEPGAPYWNAVVKIKRQLERQANDRLLATYRALVEARKGKA